MRFGEPLLPRHPWAAAMLLGTAATPAAVVIGWLAPRPLDLVFAPPLVLLDIWTSRAGNTGRGTELLLLLLGIGLTWLSYVLTARVLLYCFLPRGDTERIQ